MRACSRPAILCAAAFLPAFLASSAAMGQQGALHGELAADHFGQALRGVGDLNGDGFQDFAVGAPDNDAGGANAGRVYIYFGRDKNLPGEPDLTLTGSLAGEEFGAAVAGIGRFNGDAYDDLAVGAPMNNNGATERGRVYVFFGGPSMDTTPDLSIPGQQAGDHFGYSLDGRFDFNGDTFADLAVGAPDRPTGGQQTGEVRIYYGGSSPSTTAAVILNGEQALDQFGWSVHGAGDVNHDSFGDLIVGAPQQLALNPGKAYVCLGRSGDAAPVEIVLTGEVGGDRFGWSVGGGGNVDNDLYDDVVVGAPLNDFNASNNGAAYLFRGGSSMDATFDAKVGGRVGADKLGWAVAIDGDFNGDGRSDLIAGAPEGNDGGTNAGEIDLWNGGSPLNTGSRTVILGPQLMPGFPANDLFGTAVGFVDFNGDGHDEVLGGAPQGNVISGDETGVAAINFDPGTLVPVTLTDFSILPAGGSVRLSWRVGDGVAILGFHVEKLPESGTWRRLTPDLLLPDASGWWRYEDTDREIARGGFVAYRLVAVTRDGTTDILGPFRISLDASIRALLDPAYPNPFHAPTTIPVTLGREGPATLDIFDARGRLVRRLHDGPLPAGLTTFQWDGRDDAGVEAPSGSYFYRLSTSVSVLSRKLVLSR